MKKLGFSEEDAEAAEEVESEETTEEDSTEETEAKAVKKSNKKPSIQRYKGLGEMNAEELWETTMDRKTRTLKIVSVHEAGEADRVFEMLMGTEVGPRKSFIQTHAKSATLDI
jgi:DNA gyrase subunit B